MERLDTLRRAQHGAKSDAQNSTERATIARRIPEHVFEDADSARRSSERGKTA